MTEFNEVDGEEEVEYEDRKRKLVDMDDPFKAFQVITQTANLEYVTRLSKMLGGISEAMA